MKYVVMGTAGHVDHGKTALVRKLTGIDTDRLQEEKKRGMTIELGFAPLHLPNGTNVSIIDVPGHEKFVKTMVSGVTGIDFVLLVIAADEGVMPQTREHIDILSLLNISRGVVAVTKSDLVEADWLQLVMEDIKTAIKGSTLESLPLIPVSSVTGQGIDELLKQIERLADEAGTKMPSELFRMNIDRSFTMPGHGTVITGTIAGGEIKKGDTVEILPYGIVTRIRGVQVHNTSVDCAEAGNRCALNLTGIEKSEVGKGDVVALPGFIKPSPIVDAVIQTIMDEGEISHNQRVHIHIGTKDALARIRIIGEDSIKQGQKGYVQLRFEEPIAALTGDRFIIRSYSPVRTVGGGRIILHQAPNRSRFEEHSIETMRIEEQGGADEIILHILKSTKSLYSLDDLWKISLIKKTEIEKTLQKSVSECSVVALRDSGKFIGRNTFDLFLEDIYREFARMYKKYPFRFQMDKEELKSKAFENIDGKDYNALLNLYIENNKLKLKNNFLSEPGKETIEGIKKRREAQTIEQGIIADGTNPRRIQQILSDSGMDLQTGMEVVKFLVQYGSIIGIGDELFVHKTTMNEIVSELKEIIETKGSITVGEVRDSLKTNRKFAVALMELLDSKGLTARSGDQRVAGPSFRQHCDELWST